MKTTPFPDHSIALLMRYQASSEYEGAERFHLEYTRRCDQSWVIEDVGGLVLDEMRLGADPREKRLKQFFGIICKCFMHCKVVIEVIDVGQDLRALVVYVGELIVL